MGNILLPIVLLFKNVLIFLHGFINSWGAAIIILTLVIKLILFPTSIKQFQGMDKMKKIQPKLKEIQDKFKDKPDELQKRTMELYKKENVNPFGSCLPTLIQIPILIALYYLLSDPHYMSAYLKDAHFLWFNLSAKNDIILAVLSGVTTFFQQKLTSPAGSDSNQQMLLYMMPVFLAWVTYTVNTGVGLYWVTSNLIGIGQQYLINEYFIVKEHRHEKEESK